MLKIMHRADVHIDDLWYTHCAGELKAACNICRAVSDRDFPCRIIFGELHVLIMNGAYPAGISPEERHRIFAAGDQPADIRLCADFPVTGIQYPFIGAFSFQLNPDLCILIVQKYLKIIFSQLICKLYAGVCKCLTGGRRELLRTFKYILTDSGAL